MPGSREVLLALAQLIVPPSPLQCRDALSLLCASPSFSEAVVQFGRGWEGLGAVRSGREWLGGVGSGWAFIRKLVSVLFLNCSKPREFAYAPWIVRHCSGGGSPERGRVVQVVLPELGDRRAA